MSKYLEGFAAHITGITRHGKSYWVKKTFIPKLVKFKPVVIFDYKGEYAGPRATDHNKKWNSYDDIHAFLDSLYSKKEITQEVHVIGCRNNSDYVVGLSYLEEIRKQITIILDEAQFIFLDSKLKRASDSLITMVRAGAGDGTDVIMISQRTMDMPPNIRSQFTRRVSFLQRHSDDIKVIEKDFEDAEKLRGLKKREYMIFGDFPSHLKMDKLKSRTKGT